MKKILHVIQGMNAGGMETLIMNYYRNINRNKYQFDFLINEKDKVFYEDEIIKLGGHIYRNTLPKENIFKNRKELKIFFSNNKYDVIHCHQGITYYYPLKIAKKVGIKNRVIHNHGINRNFLKFLFIYNELWAKRRITSLGNNYVACSTTVLNHIFTNKIIENKNYTILPNAIDTSKYKFSTKKRNKIRNDLNIKNEIVLLHIGTFTKPKNHTFIIEIFNELIKTNKNYKLILVGDGPLKNEILNKVKYYNLENNIIFTGIRNDIDYLLSAADIMIFPSLYEGLPLTLIEAQASGIKILASQNITKETQQTDKITYLKIDNTKIWINEIKNTELKYDRKKYNNILKKSNFNIENATKILEKIYNKY